MSMTVMEAALVLGRTATAVGKIRRKHRDRHNPAQAPRNRPWIDDELAIALDESLSPEDAVARLDRSPQAIAAKRATWTRTHAQEQQRRR